MNAMKIAGHVGTLFLGAVLGLGSSFVFDGWKKADAASEAACLFLPEVDATEEGAQRSLVMSFDLDDLPKVPVLEAAASEGRDLPPVLRSGVLRLNEAWQRMHTHHITFRAYSGTSTRFERDRAFGNMEKAAKEVIAIVADLRPQLQEHCGS